MNQDEIKKHQLNAEEDYMTTPISVLSYITKLELQAEILTKQLAETQKHVDYAEKVSYECSKKNSQLIGKMTELTEQLLDVKSQLEISEQKVKLNYDSAIDLESKEIKELRAIIEGLYEDKAGTDI